MRDFFRKINAGHPMRTTVQRNVRSAACYSLLLLCTLRAAGQGTFQNLDFQDTTLTVTLINPGYPFPFYATNATVPGWSWSPLGTFGYGDPYTTVAYNNSALDAAAVTLHGTVEYPDVPEFVNYWILLQGGDQVLPPGYVHGAWISQTGQIPADARSLTYLGGGALQVSFNGQSLSPVVLGSRPGDLQWGVDISSYAGQTGELRFSVPSLGPGDTQTPLDEIQFSSAAIPEPSVLTLSAFGTLLLTWRFLRQTRP